MSFLKAEWRKLSMANYEIDPQILLPYVPRGTELDLWNNKCYVSLVGFMFLNTRLLGLKIPFHVNFEEVNLRFYVKRKHNNEWRRGVVFIKEIVPKPALAFVANVLYKEHYETMKMKHSWQMKDNCFDVEYSWKHEAKWNHFKVSTSQQAIPIELNSEIDFITDHFWGYAKISAQNTNEYEVTHPRWEHYPVLDYEIGVDFESLYGNEFGILNQISPTSVLLAEGSPITVESKRKLKF